MKLSQMIISWVLCRSAVALQTPLANRLFVFLCRMHNVLMAARIAGRKYVQFLEK